MKKIAKVLTFGFLGVSLFPSLVKGQGEIAKKTIFINNNATDEELKNYVPAIHDDLIIERLKCIEKDIPLTYHKAVRGQIERFMVKQRNQMQYYLMRKDRYFPIFEEVLAKHGLPDELKYLSVVESALVPNARSWASAVGLWQFMPFTGKEYGLIQDFYVDERVDPYKSTEAAALFLKKLYDRFGDWHLALAAYNSGPGRVSQAIKRAGGGKRTFWEIYPYLPNETKAYVPIFIAVNYAFNYHQEHYTASPQEVYVHIPSDTLQINNQFFNLKELAKQLDVDFEILQILNPHLKKNVVPRHYKNYTIRIPKEKSEYLAANRDDIMQICSRGSYQYMPYPKPQVANNQALLASTKGKEKKTHIVKAGEVLSNIAKEYGIKEEDLMAWNKLRNKNLLASQRLVLWVEPEKNEFSRPSDSEENDLANRNDTKNQKTPVKTVSNPSVAQIGAVAKPAKKVNSAVFHTVKQGDTLWNITQKYKGLSIDKIKQLNPNLKGNSLAVGQKIRVS